MGWPKGKKRNEQHADSTAPAAASDAAVEGNEQAAGQAEAASPAAVEQGNAPVTVTVGGHSAAPVPADPMPTDLEGFIAHCERLKQPDLVLVAVRHPDIREPRHRDGTYSGFAMEPGHAPWAKWNDGSTFPAIATN